MAQIHDGKSLSDLLNCPTEDLNDEQSAKLFDTTCRRLTRSILPNSQHCQSARLDLTKQQNALQEIMVMEEMAERRPSYVLKRGQYDARGEQVRADTPQAFPPFPEDAPHNRLGLARWLTNGEHPLTARVAVNRYWRLIFGNGLVRTPEDFGSQGQMPTHPELLDWLAGDFMTHGWDVKRLLKQFVMSATYQQSSSPGDEAVHRDPENRVVAHVEPSLAGGDVAGQCSSWSAGCLSIVSAEHRPSPMRWKNPSNRRHPIRVKDCTAAACTRTGSGPVLHRS
ncbi:MAG: DUF1553 domain-containing protein [Planctomycetaceae bacterium]